MFLVKNLMTIDKNINFFIYQETRFISYRTNHHVINSEIIKSSPFCTQP